MVDCYLEICPQSFKMMAIASFMMVYLKSGLSEICDQKLLEVENLVLHHYTVPEKSELTGQDFQTLYQDFLFSIFYLRDDIQANLRLAKQISQGYLESQNFRKDHRENQSFRGSPKFSKSSDLKIGIISHHFRRHSVTWCSLDVIEALSKLTPFLYLYPTGTLKPDDKTEAFKKLAHKFYQLESTDEKFLTSEVLLAEICQDQLDVLLDLDSLTVTKHGEILRAHPAPLCISWLGYEAPFISEKNYFLCDWHTHPPGTEEYYREKLLRMPQCFMAVGGFAVDFSQIEQFQSVIQQSKSSTDGVVYLSVAPAHKFNRDLIAAQVQILKGVPGSILLRKGQGDVIILQSLYQQECERQQVDFQRIQFLERTETEEQHRCIYSLVDIVLDSYPYHGGTHTLEALWFQVPLVTRVGEQFLARMGYSCLKALGIEAGIATSWQEYIEWGIKFGQNQALREQVKKQLNQAQQPASLSPLWNPEKFAQDLYQILKLTINS